MQNSTLNFFILCKIYDEDRLLQALPYIQLLEESDNNGDTPLIWAVKQGYERLTSNLLKAGVNVNAQNKRGQTALINAVAYGHYQIIKLLLEHGADVNIEANNETALFVACGSQEDKLDIVKLLLTKQPNLDCQNRFKMTPLMMASAYCHRKIVELLLNAGANLEAQDHHGKTALYKAIESGDEILVMFLVFAGANINVSTPNGATLSDVALREGKNKLVQKMQLWADQRQKGINMPPLENFDELKPYIGFRP